MAKLTLSDLTNLENEQTVVSAINANNALIEAFSDSVLSRNGATPNKMNANLDMNSFRIMNLPFPNADHNAVNKEYVDTLAFSITTGNVFSSLSLLEETEVSGGIQIVQVLGYSAADGIGAAKYRRTLEEPTHGLKVRSLDRFDSNANESPSDGGWWEIA